MKAFGLFLAAFGGSFFAIERMGMTSFVPPSNADVIHSTPWLIFSLMALLYFVVAATVVEKQKRMPSVWVWLISIALIVLGLWVSYLTRYNTELIITEGQSIDIPNFGENPEKSRREKYAVRPALNVTLEELNPEFNEQKTAVKSLQGKIVVRDVRGNVSSQRIIGSALPRLVNGYWMKFSGFGYSPRYVLKTGNGKVLETAFVYMDIFPEGKEDYFRLLSPVTYHLQYLSNEKDGSAERSMNLRIVRNKEILLQREIDLGEEVSFENGIISFPEIRRWTRLSVVSDMGLLPAILGSLILLLSLVLRALRK